MQRTFRMTYASALVLAMAVGGSFGTAGESKTMEAIRLPSPDKTGGMPLMEALASRRTLRAYADKELPLPLLSNLLWAACGVNREDGKRTAPTARNWQEIDVYVALAKGLYRYDPAENTLIPVLDEDIRALTGKQTFPKDAPVNLIFVSDYRRMKGADEKGRIFYSATDTGFVSQNVYLFCASEGLATVVRGLVDREALAKKMGLHEEQAIVLCQTVGYPKE